MFEENINDFVDRFKNTESIRNGFTDTLKPNSRQKR